MQHCCSLRIPNSGGRPKSKHIDAHLSAQHQSIVNINAPDLQGYSVLIYTSTAERLHSRTITAQMPSHPRSIRNQAMTTRVATARYTRNQLFQPVYALPNITQHASPIVRTTPIFDLRSYAQARRDRMLCSCIAWAVGVTATVLPEPEPELGLEVWYESLSGAQLYCEAQQKAQDTCKSRQVVNTLQQSAPARARDHLKAPPAT